MNDVIINSKTTSGPIHKMRTSVTEPVAYHLPVGKEKIHLNLLLNQKITLHYLGEISCIQCDRKIKKSFQQGYCFPCYQRLLSCQLCLIHPSKCRYYEGICHPDDWAHAHCGATHVVYLANSSGVKVGISRATNIPTRWIDQGATQGLVIMTVQNRRQAGMVEDILKQHVADKTNWQAMLKSDNAPVDLIKFRDQILKTAETDIAAVMDRYPHEIALISDATVTEIQYPVLTYPQKIKSFDFEKTPLVEGKLLGIKGQYLILDTGVISIRKFGGYCVEVITP